MKQDTQRCSSKTNIQESGPWCVCSRSLRRNVLFILPSPTGFVTITAVALANVATVLVPIIFISLTHLLSVCSTQPTSFSPLTSGSTEIFVQKLPFKLYYILYYIYIIIKIKPCLSYVRILLQSSCHLHC